MGTKTTWTPEKREEFGAKLLTLVASGMSLTKACDTLKLEGGPVIGTVIDWRSEDPAFEQRYARAREARADARSDRIDSIVDKVLSGEIDANAARVAIDAEKWQAGKENQTRYGDRLNVDQNLQISMTPEARRARIEQLMSKGYGAGLVGLDGNGAGRASEAA